ncbi:Nucleoside-diphosphate kinase [Deinococcus gobiensis I-0]|uniref:Nucleoside-diphosphate kinase n=1 Tax=Deinococcus gobiensis (strain DSM 21396 / JCM 16679 / CGMCC 1.7299 / I-0) TaxID=745776 RepID=H8GZC1_DEIGI|nr:Nucleoside-diphosphate kinase [Deinococcus gobiensis I-0]
MRNRILLLNGPYFSAE